MKRSFSEQEIVRRESLQQLIDIGIDPYPAALFEINNTSRQIKESYLEGEMLECVIAGRIMSKSEEKWLTIYDAYKKIDDLRIKYDNNKENLLILDDVNKYIESLEKNLTNKE